MALTAWPGTVTVRALVLSDVVAWLASDVTVDDNDAAHVQPYISADKAMTYNYSGLALGKRETWSITRNWRSR